MGSSTFESAGTAGALRASLADHLLDTTQVLARQRRADRLLGADGAGHLVHDLPLRADGRIASIESRPWRLDPIPVVIDAPTFRWLSLAVAERVEALAAVVDDLYGEQHTIGEGVVPGSALAATERFRVNAVGSAPKRWLSVYAVDLICDQTGAWYVVADHTDAPSGLGYALLGRSVMARIEPDILATGDVASLARFPTLMRSALAAAGDVPSPRTVVFSSGLDDPTYVDHSYLAVQLGVNLVEGPDLVVRQRRAWLRTLDGLEPVDVIYRRVPDPMVDPLEVAARGAVGVPGLLQAVRAGNVVMANAHGAGLLESTSLRPYLPAAMDRLRPMEQALTELPDAPLPFEEQPTVVDGLISTARVVVRMFAVNDGTTVSVLPGGVGRVLAPGDDPRRPTAATAKDVWVLGQTVTPVVTTRLPQVNFGRSVPTRAADALYWTNRAAERAEAMARAMRVIGSRIEQDPGLLSMHGGAWTDKMTRVASRVRRSFVPVGSGGADGLRAELSAVGDGVAVEIGTLLTEATTVREFLSVTTGRVLSHLAELRSSLQEHQTVVDDIDAVLADFAALAGLWRESTVRGPAWRIGDAGRRLERCLVVLDLLDALVVPDGVLPDDHPDVEAASLEVLLASTESLVAYRRRYRSDVERDAALSLVVHDVANPRSLAASIDTLAEHARDGQWGIGEQFVASAADALSLPVAEMVPVMRQTVIDGGTQLVQRWFSTPVNPTVMRRTGPR